MNLPVATAIAKIPGRTSCRITVPEVKKPLASPERCARFRERVLAARAFISPIELVEKEIVDRQALIRLAAKKKSTPPEPDDVVDLPEGEPHEMVLPPGDVAKDAKPKPARSKKREWK